MDNIIIDAIKDIGHQYRVNEEMGKEIQMWRKRFLSDTHNCLADSVFLAAESSTFSGNTPEYVYAEIIKACNENKSS